MWTKSHSKVYPGVTKQHIWKAWTEVSEWTKWHGDVDSCTLEGAFAVGNHFLMKITGIKKPFKVMLTEVQEGHSFTDCTKFFGAKMYDIHEMEETSEGLRITSKLVVTGPLRWLWVKLVAKNVAATVPAEMDALVEYARPLYA